MSDINIIHQTYSLIAVIPVREEESESTEGEFMKMFVRVSDFDIVWAWPFRSARRRTHDSPDIRRAREWLVWSIRAIVRAAMSYIKESYAARFCECDVRGISDSFAQMHGHAWS